jgi:acetyl esterase/lipase
MGDSAVGGLAAGVAIVSRDRNGPAIARQLLIYPMLDDRTTVPDPAIAPFAGWSYDDNITAWACAVPKPAHGALRWCFSRSLACSAVLAGQAVDDLPALDPCSHIDRLARVMQRRSFFPRLVRPMFVVVPRALGQDRPEVPFAVD